MEDEFFRFGCDEGYSNARSEHAEEDLIIVERGDGHESSHDAPYEMMDMDASDVQPNFGIVS